MTLLGRFTVTLNDKKTGKAFTHAISSMIFGGIFQRRGTREKLTVFRQEVE